MRSQGFDVYATLDVEKKEIKLWYVNAARATRSEEVDTCYWRQAWSDRVMLTLATRRSAAGGELPSQRFRDGEGPMAESMLQPRSLSYSDSEAEGNEEVADDIANRLARLGARVAALRTRTRTRSTEENEEDEVAIERMLAEHRSRYRADGTHMRDDLIPRSWGPLDDTPRPFGALDFTAISPHGSGENLPSLQDLFRLTDLLREYDNDDSPAPAGQRPPRRVSDLRRNAIGAVARHDRDLSQVAHLNSIPLDRQRELDALLESGADAERVRVLIGELEEEGNGGGSGEGEGSRGGSSGSHGGGNREGSRARRWDSGREGGRGGNEGEDGEAMPTPAEERLLEQMVSSEGDEEDMGE
jgi:uncharacterized membrane protein YgcG